MLKTPVPEEPHQNALVPLTPTPGGTPDLWNKGLALYHAQNCGACHASTAAESTGFFGPPHDNLAETAWTRLRDPRYKGSATTPAEYVRESILQPEVYRAEEYQMSRMPMPAYTHLNGEEVNALIIFLLSDPPTP